MIVTTFGGRPDRSISRLTTQASAMLAAERDERGRTPVLVIDGAHLLRYEQLETIGTLTNHNLDADSPLACLLVGQPTLRRTMKLAVLAALEQRTDPRAVSPVASRPATGGAPCRSMSGSAASAAASSRSTAGLVVTASTAAAASLAGSGSSPAITCWISVSRRQAAHGRRAPWLVSSWSSGQRATTAVPGRGSPGRAPGEAAVLR
jgi:hypothetical protein